MTSKGPRAVQIAVVCRWSESYNDTAYGILSGHSRAGVERSTFGLTAKSKILLVCDSRENAEQLARAAAESHDVVVADNPLRALAHLAREQFAGVYVSSEYLQEALELGKLLQNEQILEGMPDGVVLLDADNTIIWSNGRLAEWSGSRQRGRARTSTPSWAARKSSAPTSARSTRPWPPARPPVPRCAAARTATTTSMPLRCARRASPPRHLIVTVRDVTNEVHQQQKMAAIHQAGMELADLAPAEITHMAVQDRIELLKSNILHFTRDLLHFDVVEVRLLDQKTGRLEPLLAMGMDAGGGRPRAVRPAAEQRRDRLRGRHRQELSLRGHHRRSALPGRRQGREELADRAADAARPGDRHVQRREPGAAGVYRERPAVPGDFLPRRGRGAEHAGTAGGRKG